MEHKVHVPGQISIRVSLFVSLPPSPRSRSWSGVVSLDFEDSSQGLPPASLYPRPPPLSSQTEYREGTPEVYQYVLHSYPQVAPGSGDHRRTKGDGKRSRPDWDT